MGDKLPLSELTLSEADCFLENLICQTQGSGGKSIDVQMLLLPNIVASDLNSARGVDVSDYDRALQITDTVVSSHKKYKTGHDTITGIMSKFDVGTKVSKLGSTVAEVEPEAVMTGNSVVLTAASNVASMKFPDLTMHKVLASLQGIEGKLDQLLTTPLNKAIDYYKTIQGHWVVLQVQEEGYESSLSFRRRVAKYHKVSMRCPKFFTPKPKYLMEFMKGLQVRV